MRAASVRVSVHTSDERLPVNGRIANGPAGRKVLLGASAVVALMADGHDNAGLVVIPAMGGDAGALAQFRARAVGRHQQACLDRGAVRQGDVDAVAARVETRHRAAAQVDALAPRLAGQRVDQMAIFDHVRERFVRLDMRRANVRNTGRVASSSLESVTTMSRMACVPRRDLVPDPERIEQPAAAGDDRGRARIAARPRSPAPDRTTMIGNVGAERPDAAPAPAPARQTRRRR